MSFLWPSALAGLVLIPLLMLLFVWARRRRRRYAARYSSLSLVRAALPAGSRLRRYLPMALFYLGLASLVMSFARPVVAAQVPAGRATIMLTLDVSGSMRQTDIAPSRLDAAKEAALSFVQKQKDTNQVGVVAFAGISQLVQAPSANAEDLAQAIRSLRTGRSTAIGEGIVTALDTILEFSQSAGSGTPPAASGEYRPDIIVVLTDGVNTTGIDPLDASQQARDSGVRIYTIGFGTETGAQPRSGRPDFFGGRRWGIDEAALRSIAATTGGKYYTASSASELQGVFDKLPTAVTTREEKLELGFVGAALAAILVGAAVFLSQLWHPLP